MELLGRPARPTIRDRQGLAAEGIGVILRYGLGPVI